MGEPALATGGAIVPHAYRAPQVGTWRVAVRAPILLCVRRLTFALLAVLLGWPVGGMADQGDTRLPGLFERLQTAADEAEAVGITHEIWAIWRQTDNEAADALMEQGLGAMRLEHYDQALSALSKVVEIAPEYAEGWNARATLLYLMGDYEASAIDVRRTLALEPRHFGAWSGLGLIHMSVGNEKAALEAFERALRINPHLQGSRQNLELVRQRLREKRI